MPPIRGWSRPRQGSPAPAPGYRRPGQTPPAPPARRAHASFGRFSRQKEIQYSSRTRANTDQFKQIQCVRMALANVLEKIPCEALDSEDGQLLQSVADRNVYQIVHLIYRSKNYEVQSKDYEFSRTSMIDHWNAGYNDAIRTLRHPEALQRPTDQTGVATFDVAVDGRE